MSVNVSRSGLQKGVQIFHSTPNADQHPYGGMREYH